MRLIPVFRLFQKIFEHKVADIQIFYIFGLSSFAAAFDGLMVPVARLNQDFTLRDKD